MRGACILNWNILNSDIQIKMLQVEEHDILEEALQGHGFVI